MVIKVAFLPLLLVSAVAADKPVLVVLDFSSPGEGELGRKLADTFRKKLEREEAFTMPDAFEMNEIVKASKFEAKLDDPKGIAQFVREKLKADLVLWGDCWLDGETYTVSLRAMDLRQGVAAPFLDETHTCKGYPAVSALARGLTASLTGAAPREPDQSSPEVRSGTNLLPNGDFEQGDASPLHWQKVNGLTTFWQLDPGPRKRCIRMDTDVYEREVLDWQKKLAAGADVGKAPRKTPTTGPKYDTIGGTYGVPLFSDFIEVKPGAEYRLSVDVKAGWGGMFFPKVFVKGYGAEAKDEFGQQSRELYSTYLALRTQTAGRDWEHFSRVFHPTKATPGVKKMRVMLYAYWPPGEYYFDNVRISEER
jgi:hypothetical protein